jgi:hypothetical protein
VSYAEANQVKFTQAHQIPKKTIAYATTAWPTCPAATSWASSAAARETATTKVRSKSSSSGVEARCSSSAARAVMGRRMGIRRVPGPGALVMAGGYRRREHRSMPRT